MGYGWVSDITFDETNLTQTSPQPVRFQYHSHRGPWSACGGKTGFIQDEGVFKGGTEQPYYMPRTLQQFSAARLAPLAVPRIRYLDL